MAGDGRQGRASRSRPTSRARTSCTGRWSTFPPTCARSPPAAAATASCRTARQAARPGGCAPGPERLHRLVRRRCLDGRRLDSATTARSRRRTTCACTAISSACSRSTSNALELPDRFTAADVQRAMHGHVLARSGDLRHVLAASDAAAAAKELRRPHARALAGDGRDREAASPPSGRRRHPHVSRGRSHEKRPGKAGRFHWSTFSGSASGPASTRTRDRIGFSRWKNVCRCDAGRPQLLLVPGCRLPPDVTPCAWPGPVIHEPPESPPPTQALDWVRPEHGAFGVVHGHVLRGDRAAAVAGGAPGAAQRAPSRRLGAAAHDRRCRRCSC